MERIDIDSDPDDDDTYRRLASVVLRPAITVRLFTWLSANLYIPGIPALSPKSLPYSEPAIYRRRK
jgi:hypothetical protein